MLVVKKTYGFKSIRSLHNLFKKLPILSSMNKEDKALDDIADNKDSRSWIKKAAKTAGKIVSEPFIELYHVLS